MSVKAMSSVFDAEGFTPVEKLVLLALADHASEDGLNIYPSVERVCRKTALSERAVRKTIAELRSPERGILFLVKRRGNRQNEYGINLSDLHQMQVRPAPDAGLNPTDLHHVPDRPAPRAPKSSVETSDTDQLSRAVAGADKPRRARTPANNTRGQAPDKPASPFREIQKAYEDLCGYPVIWRNGQSVAAKWLADQGFSSQDVIGCYNHMKRDPFWQGKPIHLSSIVKQIGHWRHSQTDPNAGKSAMQIGLEMAIEKARQNGIV